jgi:hypothetical protein
MKSGHFCSKNSEQNIIMLSKCQSELEYAELYFGFKQWQTTPISSQVDNVSLFTPFLLISIIFVQGVVHQDLVGHIFQCLHGLLHHIPAVAPTRKLIQRRYLHMAP